MKQKYNTEEEIKKTLGLLDNKDDAKLSEYFDTRLNSKIAGLSDDKNIWSARLNPAFVLTILLLLVINAFTAINYFNASTVNEITRESLIKAVAQSYSSVNYSAYNY